MAATLQPHGSSFSLRETFPVEEMHLQRPQRGTPQGLFASIRALMEHSRPTLGVIRSENWLTLAQCNGTPPLVCHLKAIPLSGKTLSTSECLTLLRNELRQYPHGMKLWFRFDKPGTIALHTMISSERYRPEQAFALLLDRADRSRDAASFLFQYRLGGQERLSPFNRLFPQKPPLRQPLAVLGADKKTVYQLRHQFTGAGVEPHGFTDAIHCLENLYASRWLTCHWSCFALVEITENGTHLAVFERMEPNTDAQPALIFSRTLRTGVRELLDAEPAETTPTMHEVAVTQTAHLYQRAASPEEAALLEKALQRLGQQIHTSITQFVSPLTPFPVQGMLVAGPDGILEDIVRLFGESTGLPCHPLSLSGRMSAVARTALRDLKTPPSSENTGSIVPPPPFLQAIGLALSSSRTPNVLLGFWEQQKQARRALKNRAISTAMALLLLILIILAGKGVVDLLNANDYKKQLQKELAEWNELVTVADLEKSLKETEATNARARLLAERRFPAALLAEIASMTPPTVYLASFRLTLPQASPPDARTKQQTRRSSQKNTLPAAIFTGITTGDALQRESGLVEFLSNLEQCPLVASLLIEKQPIQGDSITFTATARLSLP